MSALVFVSRGHPPERLDLSPLTPDRLDGLTVAEIERLPAGTSRKGLFVGDQFAVTGSDVSDIRFEGVDGRSDGIGSGMTGGRITVDGRAGAYLGLGMVGGLIDLRGDAGPYAGSGMTGGSVAVSGSVGDFAGGPRAGEMRGMAGGMLHVRGNAGSRCGDRMRRGLVIVEGQVGDRAASRMIAGTLAVGGTVGPELGLGMKRGTVVLATAAPDLLPTFVDCGPHTLAVLSLLNGALARADSAVRLPGGRARRFMGDMAALGLGEVFLPA